MNDNSLDHFLGAKPTSPSRRVFGFGLLAVATVAALALLVRFLVGTDLPYYTAPVERADLTPELTARGEVRGQHEITIRATQDGIIDTLPGPAEGAVNQGQILASFDPAPIDQTVLSDQAALDEAQATLDRAEIAATEMTTRLERYENVWHRSNGRVPSLNEMEGARADAQRAGVDLDAAQPQRDRARLQLAASQARRIAVDILAPASGFVTARFVQPGQSVHLDQPLFTIATSLGGLQVVVPIGAVQAGSLDRHAKARVLIDGLADQIRIATLAAIWPGAGGSAERQAVFTLDQPEHKAHPGMVATIATELPLRKDVLLVPNAALTFVPGATGPNPCGCIYVLSQQGTPRRVAIVAGASDGSRTEVLSGEIEPGTKVVIGWRGGTVARR